MHRFSGFALILIFSLSALLQSACSPVQPTNSLTPGLTAPTLPPATAASATQTPVSQPPASPPAPVVTLEPVSTWDHMLGRPEAEITLLIFADYQSPAAAYVMDMIPDISQRHQDTLRIILRPFPLLTVNEHALAAAKAAEAASSQNRYWDFARALFSNQDTWSTMSEAEFSTFLQELALELELDTVQFEDDSASVELEEELLEDFYQNVAAGLFNSPTLYLNENEYLLPLTMENIEASIRLEELKSSQLDAYPDFSLEPGAQYSADIHTSLGNIRIQLYPDYAPLSVNSFVSLAGMGWYDNTPFYRVIQGSFVEAGDPTGTGLGDPGYVLPLETEPTLNFSKPGMVSLVSPAQDANGSSFFITLEPLQHLDSYRTIFGRVTEGLELLEVLEDRDPIQQLLEEPQAEILSIDIIKD